jgi:Holliday junction DNA helicase RuvA
VGGDVIAHIRGTLLSSSPSCVVEVGGVGFEIHITEKDRGVLARGTSGEVSFHTYLHVREDRITLFGFLRAQERELFTRLIDVTGVGPRTALGIMAEETAERIVRAVRGEDHAFLCRLPGLGKKTAERLVLELKDKLDDLEAEAAEIEPAAVLRDEAILALTSLGMPRHAAQRALERIDWKRAESSDLEAIIKEALKHVGSA